MVLPGLKSDHGQKIKVVEKQFLQVFPDSRATCTSGPWPLLLCLKSATCQLQVYLSLLPQISSVTMELH